MIDVLAVTQQRDPAGRVPDSTIAEWYRTSPWVLKTPQASTGLLSRAIPPAAPDTSSRMAPEDLTLVDSTTNLSTSGTTAGYDAATASAVVDVAKAATKTNQAQPWWNNGAQQ